MIHNIDKKTIRRNIHYIKSVLFGGHWKCAYDFYLHELNTPKYYFCNKVELTREVLFIGIIFAIIIFSFINLI
jgi:hypothetical protein